MSSKPIYIGIIGFLVIALIVTGAILIGRSNQGETILAEGTAGSIGNLFNNDNVFPETVGETLTMTVNPNNNYLINNKSNDLYLKLDFSAVKYETENVLPLNISLVLDRSGSMAGKKLEQAKKAVNAFIDSLSVNDYLSIVTYESGVQILYPQSKIENKEALKELINSIQDAGGTFLSGGLEEGIAQIETKKSDDFINRVILFSDGQANEGIFDIEGLSTIAKRAAEKGISVSTMGVGLDYDEKIMSALAINGSGNYQYIKNAVMITEVLDKELSQLKNIVASEAKVKIIHDPSIKFAETFGYTYNSTEGYVEIPIRDFFSEDKGMAILHFTTDTKNISDHNLKIVLSYKDAINGKVEKTFDTGIALNVTDEQTVYNDNLDIDVMSEIVKIKNTLAMEKANVEFEKGNKDKAIEIYNEAINFSMTENSTMGGISDLEDQIGYMEEQSELLNTLENAYDANAKDYLKSNRVDNMSMQQGRINTDKSTNDDDENN